MLSKRILALFVAPLMLGGCTTMQSLGDHAASAVGLQDDAPQELHRQRRVGSKPAPAWR